MNNNYTQKTPTPALASFNLRSDFTSFVTAHTHTRCILSLWRTKINRCMVSGNKSHNITNCGKLQAVCICVRMWPLERLACVFDDACSGLHRRAIRATTLGPQENACVCDSGGRMRQQRERSYTFTQFSHALYIFPAAHAANEPVKCSTMMQVIYTLACRAAAFRLAGASSPFFFE